MILYNKSHVYLITDFFFPTFYDSQLELNKISR